MHVSPFERLPREILSQIIETLESESPSSLFNLLFIRPSKQIVESIIHKSVVLRGPHPGSASPWPRTKHLIDRILDPNEDVSTYIRGLEIENWPGPHFPEFDKTILEKILRNMKILHSFTWNSNHHIPKDVIELLHARFPEARLCCVNRTRARDIMTTGEYSMAMDLNALSSPQLYSLEYTFFKEASGLSRSELPIIGQIIKKKKNLRILRFVCEPHKLFQYEDHSEYHEIFGSDGRGFKNLPLNAFTPDDQLAPLQELVFMTEPLRVNTFYDFTDSHCIAWKSCMDWSKLVTLDLGGQGPSTFFEIFRGYVPNLKSFRFTLTRGGPQSIGVDNVRIIGDFLDAITGLEELCITNASNGFFPILWSYVKRHGPTLRVLKTKNVYNATWRWTSIVLNELLQTCSQLKSLTIDLEPDCTIGLNREKAFLWPKQSFLVLSQFPQLKTLQIAVEMFASASGGVDAEPATSLTTEMFVNFYQHNPRSQMKRLELSVRKVEYAAIHETCIHTVAVTVTKPERDDVPSPVEGGYQVGAKQRVWRHGAWEEVTI